MINAITTLPTATANCQLFLYFDAHNSCEVVSILRIWAKIINFSPFCPSEYDKEASIDHKFFPLYDVMIPCVAEKRRIL